MNDAIFQSSLSEKEIENNFKNADLFSGIMAGLEEALAEKLKNREKGKSLA